MEKIKLGAKNLLYPMPTTLVGTLVDGKPNFLAIAWCGIVAAKPPMISVCSSKRHFSNAGIHETGTFSVNIPSAEMVKAADYCGIVSGRKDDKSGLFEVFYGELGSAPMIKACPINMECRVVRVIDDLDPTEDIFIGQIIQTYSSENYLTDGDPDLKKIDPIIFSTVENQYYAVGKVIGQAWKIGQNYR